MSVPRKLAVYICLGMSSHGRSGRLPFLSSWTPCSHPLALQLLFSILVPHTPHTMAVSLWWGNGFALVGYIFKFLHPHTFPHCHKSIYPCTHLHGELYSPRPIIPPARSPRGVASPVTHIPPALSPRDMSIPKTVLSTSNSICAESAGILIQLTNQLLVFRCCHEHREFVF